MRTLLFVPFLAGSVQAQAVLLHELASPNEEPRSHFGNAVSGVPDVDGDDVSDLLVGAYWEGPTTNGRAYVFSGASGDLLYEIVSPHQQRHGVFGYSAAGVEDVDGDGRGDLLAGAPLEDGATGGSGRAYVFSGADGVLLYELARSSSSGSAGFGNVVAGMQDVDGDERGDLLVCAAGSRVYVFSGATGVPLYDRPSPSEDRGHFCWSASGVPDVDDDASGDFVVGAFSGQRAYVFSGARGVLLHAFASPNEEQSGQFGWTVSGVPDVDDDGLGDLLVGAYGESPGASPEDAGRAYVFSGANGALLHELASPNEEVGGVFGYSVSGVPDVDGDGRGDLLVGASGEGRGGRAYVFSGATGGLIQQLEAPNVNFGSKVGGVGDLDGDGRGDLLIGAPSASPPSGPSQAGRAYVFSGASPSAPAVVVEPVAPPVVVPAEGGPIPFTVALTSQSAAPYTWELWGHAVLDGAPVGDPLGPVSVPLAPGQDTTLVLEDAVGAEAPPGDYVYAVSVGRYPSYVAVARGFPFTKLALTAGEGAPAGAPTFALSAEPNPSSGRVSLAYELPTSSRVRLSAFDVLGREVAVLVAGEVAAGRHEVVFDGSALPSGVYVVRLAAGDAVRTQRLTLAR